MIGFKKIGASLTSDLIPFSKYAKKLIEEKKTNYNHLLTGGDDYELIFTANSKKSLIIKRLSKKNNIKVTRVGKIIRKKGIYLDKKLIKIVNKSFQHFS